MKALALVDRIIQFFESIFINISAAAFFVIMLIISFDVGFRYFLNAPLDWAFPVITLYLMGASFFFALSRSQRDNYNIRVDILLRVVGPSARHAMELVAYALTTIVMAGIFYQGTIRFLRNFHAGDVVPGAIPWPTWPTSLIVPIGVGLLLIRLIFGTVTLIAALATRADSAVGISESNVEIEE